jgi:hypothetical protein
MKRRGFRKIDCLPGHPHPIPVDAGRGLFVAWQRSVGRFGAAMIVMAIFIGLNSILFQHYPAWPMPLLPLAAGEWLLRSNEQPEQFGKV